MDNKLIEDIVNQILKNEEFKKECKNSINAVLKDGKLDMADTPYILNLVVVFVSKFVLINLCICEKYIFSNCNVNDVSKLL